MSSPSELKALRLAITKEVAEIAKISVENARKLEAYLYSSAQSVEAYGDRGTLRDRLKEVVRKLKEKKSGQPPAKEAASKQTSEAIVVPVRKQSRRPMQEESPFLVEEAKRTRVRFEDSASVLEDLARLEEEVLGLMRIARSTVSELRAVPSENDQSLSVLVDSFAKGVTRVHEGLRRRSGLLRAVPVLGEGHYLRQDRRPAPPQSAETAAQGDPQSGST